MVHEVDNTVELLHLDSSEVQQGMLVRMPPENVLEEGAAGGEDDLVGLHLVVLARQGHVEEVPVVSEFLQRCTDVGLEIIPPQTKVVSSHL